MSSPSSPPDDNDVDLTAPIQHDVNDDEITALLASVAAEDAKNKKSVRALDANSNASLRGGGNDEGNTNSIDDGSVDDLNKIPSNILANMGGSILSGFDSMTLDGGGSVSVLDGGDSVVGLGFGGSFGSIDTLNTENAKRGGKKKKKKKKKIDYHSDSDSESQSPLPRQFIDDNDRDDGADDDDNDNDNADENALIEATPMPHEILSSQSNNSLSSHPTIASKVSILSTIRRATSLFLRRPPKQVHERPGMYQPALRFRERMDARYRNFKDKKVRIEDEIGKAGFKEVGNSVVYGGGQGNS